MQISTLSPAMMRTAALFSSSKICRCKEAHRSSMKSSAERQKAATLQVLKYHHTQSPRSLSEPELLGQLCLQGARQFLRLEPSPRVLISAWEQQSEYKVRRAGMGDIWMPSRLNARRLPPWILGCGAFSPRMLRKPMERWLILSCKRDIPLLSAHQLLCTCNQTFVSART